MMLPIIAADLTKRSLDYLRPEDAVTQQDIAYIQIATAGWKQRKLTQLTRIKDALHLENLGAYADSLTCSTVIGEFPQLADLYCDTLLGALKQHMLAPGAKPRRTALPHSHYLVFKIDEAQKAIEAVILTALSSGQFFDGASPERQQMAVNEYRDFCLTVKRALYQRERSQDRLAL